MQPTTIAIPDCSFHYQYGDDAFAIDPIEAIEVTDKLIAENAGDFGYLDVFGKWLKEQGGPELPRDVLDWLIDHIRTRYAEIKKKRFEPLNSPSSTD